MDEILKMSDKIDFDKLIYNFKGSTHPVNLVNLEVQGIFMDICKKVI